MCYVCGGMSSGWCAGAYHKFDSLAYNESDELFSTWMFYPDDVGTACFQKLEKKAREGVEVGRSVYSSPCQLLTSCCSGCCHM